MGGDATHAPFPAFDRSFFRSPAVFSRIGSGAIGGKAAGLVRMRSAFETRLPGGRAAGIPLAIPRLIVLATDVFDEFIALNHLRDVVEADPPNGRMAHAFLHADLPAEILGDLRALVEEVHTPLAVRSSSLLEDTLERPFAGIYATKMTPNNAPDADTRFRRLVEAIKFVYASTYLRGARAYRRACGIPEADEKMAVVIQEVVGERHGDRFYPDASAVCRSYSYYPASGARPEDGVASLALGLGKTIVDGGRCWSYSPWHPRTPPPFASVQRMLHETQTRFWAVNMGHPPAFDPMVETEYLVEGDLVDADRDGVLGWLASTYDPEADRLRPGIGIPGPRVLDFAPILRSEEVRLSDALRSILALCEQETGTQVEIEVALMAPRSDGAPPRLALLQVRPMMAPEEIVEVGSFEAAGPGLLLSTTRALGNGAVDTLRDIVYLRPEAFDAGRTRRIASELERLNRTLVQAGTPYLLIGFGRWGSADPWLGVPVGWAQISGARAIVEAPFAALHVEPSQGSHFFHNLSSLRVLYFTVAPGGPGIDWRWLAEQPAVEETELVRHVRLERPLRMRVDGRSGRGVIEIPAGGAKRPAAAGSTGADA